MFVSIASVAIWAIPAIASAHAGNNDPNAVHACIGKVSKIVRIVGVSDACISSLLVAETPVHSNIQGLPGTNGINGTNGTNGINGASVTFAGHFGGNQNGCPDGGAIFAAGSVNANICNGTNATRSSSVGTDGPCFDNSNRYVDCGNGTVTDTVTGLIWLKQWNCLDAPGQAQNRWAAASQAAAGLQDGDCGLTDHSSGGDWRLPTKDEWSATIARAFALGCTSSGSGGPSLTDDAGTACYGNGGGSSFANVAGDQIAYWSSTAYETLPYDAWTASLDVGALYIAGLKGDPNFHVWPVRGGR
jgi:hypothetical protein